MKKINTLLIACTVVFTLTSCFEDMDDTISASSKSVKDFVWKGMNIVYLYKADMPDLADDRFATNEEYTTYLNSFDTPEALFESLKYMPNTTDRFSRIYPNYFDLQNALQGVTLNNGIEFNLYRVPGNSTQVYGAITLVLNNSPASNLGLLRGQIFRAVNGESLTEDNFSQLLNQNTYTLNFANYNDNGTPNDESDDTITLNNESAELTKITYTENPVHITEVIEVGDTKIGYLMYNSFNSSFNNELNNAFGQFQTAGIDELVIDLRYNGGGSVETASYLGSMITGQYNGEIYSKLFYNEGLQNNNRNYLFTNSIDGGDSINSLNLSKVYILTTKKRTASASELVINSLKAYMDDVVVIGEETVGKTQASITVYDSANLQFQNVNPNHTYAMQPLVANSTNVNDELVPSSGIVPTIQISETASNLGILGDPTEPLLAEAISQITGNVDRTLFYNPQPSRSIDIKPLLNPLEQEMYID